MDPNNSMRPTPSQVTPQGVIGAVIVVYGVLLTLRNLGSELAGRALGLWPLGLVAVGVASYNRAPDRTGRFFGGLIAAGGGWLTVSRVFDWHVRLSDLWPLVIVAVGISIVLRAFGASDGEKIGNDQTLSGFALFSSVRRRVTSSSFKHADLTAVMGGVQLDLSSASTAGGEAVIDVMAMWGGIEIRVPPDWAVSNQVIAIMGGVDDRSAPTTDAKNRLVLRGFVMMGGVEIKT